MRSTARAGFIVMLLLGGWSGAQLLEPAWAQNAVRRPYLSAAESAFYGLSATDRIEMHLLLVATGDFNAMVSDRFGGRLYDAIVSFQGSQDLPETGVLTPEVVARLRAVGGPILASWGLHFVDHPTADVTLSLPGRFGLVAHATRRGLAFENRSRTFSVDFAFFPADEVPMAEIYDNLSAPVPGRRIDMKVIRNDFFAVAGGGDRFGTYSRYIAVSGGSAGFTVTWNTDYFPNGNRVAVIMANGLLPHRDAPPATAEAPAPVEASPPPARQAAVEAPKSESAAPVLVQGSAVYVSPVGDLVTNNHVVAGCGSATVVGAGSASIVARDGKNDLALLRLTTAPGAGTLRPVTFRTAPLQLGEAVYVLGYPYAGALDNGVNFTNGMVSSVAGMENDSTRFELTAPVQPGNSGGPVLDQSGALVGIVVSRMSDIAALKATNTVPQNVNFGIKGEVVASFLRANGVTPASVGDTAARPATEIASTGKASTAQVTCVRPAAEDER